MLSDILKHFEIFASLPQYLFWFVSLCIYLFVGLLMILVGFVIYRMIRELSMQMKLRSGHKSDWNDELKTVLGKAEIDMRFRKASSGEKTGAVDEIVDELMDNSEVPFQLSGEEFDQNASPNTGTIR